jgi:5'-3' exonuclease
LGVGWVQVPEHEADDVMASIVNMLPPDTTATLVTDDKDLLQCVGQRVSVLKPSTWRFVTVDDVISEWGVQPVQIADVLALMGDASDNVSGVPGIGKKTACSLVARWGSLQGILDNIDQVPGRAGTLIESYSEQAKKSLALVSLKNDACGLEVLTEATTLSGRNT